MILLSFVSMYVLMYAMVNTFDNARMNVNQIYMAGLMTSPMVLLELWLMRTMFHNKRWNLEILAAGVIGLVVFFMLIRQQTAVGDRQFLKSMIPHHAGAILMCREAKITDPEIKKLCDGIATSQQGEIQWMEAKLKQLDR